MVHIYDGNNGSKMTPPFLSCWPLTLSLLPYDLNNRSGPRSPAPDFLRFFFYFFFPPDDFDSPFSCFFNFFFWPATSAFYIFVGVWSQRTRFCFLFFLFNVLDVGDKQQKNVTRERLFYSILIRQQQHISRQNLGFNYIRVLNRSFNLARVWW